MGVTIKKIGTGTVTFTAMPQLVSGGSVSGLVVPSCRPPAVPNLQSNVAPTPADAGVTVAVNVHFSTLPLPTCVTLQSAVLAAVGVTVKLAVGATVVVVVEAVVVVVVLATVVVVVETGTVVVVVDVPGGGEVVLLSHAETNAIMEMSAMSFRLRSIQHLCAHRVSPLGNRQQDATLTKFTLLLTWI